VNTLVFRVRHEARPEEIVDGFGNDIGYPPSDTTPRFIPWRILEQLNDAPDLSFIIFSRDIDLELVYRTPYQLWEQVGIRGVVISSFTNGAHELVHLRTLTRSRHRNEDEEGRFGKAEDSIFDDMDEEERYALGERLRWEHAVAYDGEMVAEDILEKAFEAAGSDWTKSPIGRRLDLPEIVWQILKIWVDQGRPPVLPALEGRMASL
jgi:hypothetical protein